LVEVVLVVRLIKTLRLVVAVVVKLRRGLEA
jgi:hypothetical protein